MHEISDKTQIDLPIELDVGQLAAVAPRKGLPRSTVFEAFYIQEVRDGLRVVLGVYEEDSPLQRSEKHFHHQALVLLASFEVVADAVGSSLVSVRHPIQILQTCLLVVLPSFRRSHVQKYTGVGDRDHD